MKTLGARIVGYGVATLVLIAVAGTRHVDAHQAPFPQHEHLSGCASLQRAQRHLADSKAALHTYMMAHKIAPAELRADLTMDPTLTTLYARRQAGQVAFAAVTRHLAQLNFSTQRARHDLARSSAALHAYMAAHHIAPVGLQAQASIDPTLTKLYQRVQADQEIVTTTQFRITSACR